VGSPEFGLAATAVGKTSPWAGKKRDKAMGNLSKGGNQRLVGGMRSVSEGNGTRHRISGARWGKTLRVKWQWLQAPFIASGR
jgi:hypothetical protein